MSFQRCPICEGLGWVGGAWGQGQCGTCRGHGIIDEITGLPPYGSKTPVISTGLEITELKWLKCKSCGKDKAGNYINGYCEQCWPGFDFDSVTIPTGKTWWDE